MHTDWRDRYTKGTDVQHVRMMKDKYGKVMADGLIENTEGCERMMNEENEGEREGSKTGRELTW